MEQAEERLKQGCINWSKMDGVWPELSPEQREAKLNAMIADMIAMYRGFKEEEEQMHLHEKPEK
jgi:hypothetical protein